MTTAGKKVLVLYAHFNSASFNHAILEVVTEELTKAGATPVVRDLYGMGFQPLIHPSDFKEVAADVKQEQDLIRECAGIVIVHPTHWFGLPTVLRGYIDRVMTAGFAYRYNKDLGRVEGLLGPKKVLWITTCGAAKEPYDQYGLAIYKGMEHGIFEFCGLSVLEHQLFYSVPQVSDQDRKAMLETVHKLVQKHATNLTTH